MKITVTFESRRPLQTSVRKPYPRIEVGIVQPGAAGVVAGYLTQNVDDRPNSNNVQPGDWFLSPSLGTSRPVGRYLRAWADCQSGSLDQMRTALKEYLTSLFLDDLTTGR